MVRILIELSLTYYWHSKHPAKNVLDVKLLQTAIKKKEAFFPHN